MKSYKQNFLDNLDEEISEFRAKTLSQNSQEIYNDANRISFYEAINKYLRWGKFENQEYKLFLESDTSFIFGLWCKSLKWDEFNANSPIDFSILVDNYINAIKHNNFSCM